MIEVHTVGEVVMDTDEKADNILEIDSIKVPEYPEILGVLAVEPDDEINQEVILGMLIAQTPPEFKNTPSNLSKKEKRDYLSKGISKIVTENFNTSVCLNLKGRQKVYVQFQIDTLGILQNIKARAVHPSLEKEAIRILKLLPQFIPAQQANKPVKTVYTLPIIFQTEE